MVAPFCKLLASSLCLKTFIELANLILFCFQGECVIIHSKDWEADDMAEISARLKSVTPGAASQEFSLRRNQLGQLGFHVQHDGLITEVLER